MICQCLNYLLRQIIDLLATDKSRYFAQPRPIIANYLQFSIWKEFFFFRLHEKLYQNENFIQNENHEISFCYHENKYREIYGDGINSFQNESHSGIM